MIIAGFGFRSGATVESLKDALAKAGAGGDVQIVATADDKAHAGIFVAFADQLGAEPVGIDPETLAAQKTKTRSPASLSARGTGSVAEAAALAAAGPGGRLLRPRAVSDDTLATCALAERGSE